jgi:septal ring factor EnvC (AmiA/AmiB activator)
MGIAYSSDPATLIQAFETEIQNLKDTLVRLETDLEDFKHDSTVNTETLLVDLEIYKMKLSKFNEMERECDEKQNTIISLQNEVESVKTELDKIIVDLKQEISDLKKSKCNIAKSETEYYMKKYQTSEEENNRLKKHIQVYQALLENK